MDFRPTNYKAKILEVLRERAPFKMPISYKALARMVGMPFGTDAQRQRLFDILGEIGTEEKKEGRPPLNVLVFSVELGTPGPGFYTWYEAYDPRRKAAIDLTRMEREQIQKELTNECKNYWLEKKRNP